MGPSWLLNPDQTPPPALPADRHVFWHADAQSLLRALIVGEAATEPPDGMFAVGAVARTRCILPWWWGKNWWQVILMPGQFSCLWGEDWAKRRGDMLAALDRTRGFEAANTAAIEVLRGRPDLFIGSTHYFNEDLVKPAWAAHMLKLGQIGGHGFYGYER